MTPFYEDKVRIELGEGYVIAPTEILEHVVSVYTALAEESEDPEPWMRVARLFEEWTSHTGFYPEDLEDEEDETFEEFDNDDD